MGPRARTIRQRIEDAVEKEADGQGCWRWKMHKDRKGYGRFIVATKEGPSPSLAHRVAYAEWIGPIPDGLDVDHLCFVRDCVNPAHLEAVTHAVNVARRDARRRATTDIATHCRHGHSYDEANTYINTIGVRNCRACRRQWAVEYNARRNAKRLAAKAGA